MYCITGNPGFALPLLPEQLCRVPIPEPRLSAPLPAAVLYGKLAGPQELWQNIACCASPGHVTAQTTSLISALTRARVLHCCRRGEQPEPSAALGGCATAAPGAECPGLAPPSLLCPGEGLALEKRMF